MIPFVILLLALAYVPFASQQATVDAALVREQGRHRLLVDQVAMRFQALAHHLESCLERLASALSRPGFAPDRIEEEVRDALEHMTEDAEAEGLAVLDSSGGVMVEVGDPGIAEPAVRGGLLDVFAQASTAGGKGSRVWAGPDRGVRLTMWEGIATGGAAPATVVLTLRPDRLVRRLFEGGLFGAGVSFTVTGADGSVLLHSGIAPGAGGTSSMGEACNSCHASAPVLTRLGTRRPGGGRFVAAGVERVVAWAPVELAGQAWTISTSTPVREVVRPVAQQTIVSMSFTLAVVVILLLFGLLLRQAQIRRIRLEDELATQARMLALAREKERLDAELGEARRMASIGEMVARVAHEVKNPLQYIGTAADLLADLARDPVAVELVGDMRTGVRRLNAIVTELLDFSRPMRLDISSVDVNDVVAEVAGRMVPKTASVKQDLFAGLPAVQADGFKIRQVFENLVANAVDALPAPGAGDRVIEIVTRPGEGRFAGGVTATVRDTGTGIPQEDIDRIFEPFVTTKTHGTGLGLAIVRRIVEAHRGEVRVESRPGAGSAFTVSLPPAAGGATS